MQGCWRTRERGLQAASSLLLLVLPDSVRVDYLLSSSTQDKQTRGAWRQRCA
jgi:hypothetical protein